MQPIISVDKLALAIRTRHLGPGEVAEDSTLGILFVGRRSNGGLHDKLLNEEAFESLAYARQALGR
jgi:hypothetical protein